MGPPGNKITPLGITLLSLVLLGIGWTVWRAATQSNDVGPDRSLERIRERGTIRVGFANERPYGYLNTDTGEITGEAPEVAKYVFEKLGIEHFEPVVTEFGTLIPGLQARRFDVIAAGMYITPERGAEIAFSNPTYAIGEGFIVLAGNPKNLHSYETLAENQDARLGVMGGSVEHGYAQSLGVSDDRIVLFPDYLSAMKGLEAGRIDAVGATANTINDLLSKAENPNIERADPFENPVIDGRSILGYGAFGFHKEDEALRDAFNEVLADFIGSPEHLEMVERFGFGENTLPGDITARQLIEGNH